MRNVKATLNTYIHQEVNCSLKPFKFPRVPFIKSRKIWMERVVVSVFRLLLLTVRVGGQGAPSRGLQGRVEPQVQLQN